jgi:hypothetical protein
LAIFTVSSNHGANLIAPLSWRARFALSLSFFVLVLSRRTRWASIGTFRFSQECTNGTLLAITSTGLILVRTRTAGRAKSRTGFVFGGKPRWAFDTCFWWIGKKRGFTKR